jgi:hypothetical protein
VTTVTDASDHKGWLGRLVGRSTIGSAIAISAKARELAGIP